MKGIAFKVKRVISLVLSVALISGMILNLPITSSAVSTPVSEDESKNETVAEKEIIEETPEVKEEESLVAVEVAKESEEQGETSEEDEETADIEEDEVVADGKLLGEPDGAPDSGTPVDPDGGNVVIPDISEAFDVTYNYAFSSDEEEEVTFEPIKEIKAKDGDNKEYSFKYSFDENGTDKEDKCVKVSVTQKNVDEKGTIYIFVTPKDEETKVYRSVAKLYSAADVSVKNNSGKPKYTGADVAFDVGLVFNASLPDDIGKDISITKYEYTYEDEGGLEATEVDGFDGEVVISEADAGNYEAIMTVQPTFGSAFKCIVDLTVDKAKEQLHLEYPENVIDIDGAHVCIVSPGATISLSVSNETDGAPSFSVAIPEDEGEYILYPSASKAGDAETNTEKGVWISYTGKFKVGKSGDAKITVEVPNGKNHDYTPDSLTLSIHVIGDPLFNFAPIDNKYNTKDHTYFKSSTDRNGVVKNNITVSKSQTNECVKLYTSINASGNGYGNDSIDKDSDNGWYNNHDIQWLMADKLYNYTQKKESDTTNKSDTAESPFPSDVTYTIESLYEGDHNPFRFNEDGTLIYPNLTSKQQEQIIQDVKYDDTVPLLCFDKNTGELSYLDKYKFYAYYLSRTSSESPSFKITATLEESDKFETYSESYIVQFGDSLPENTEEEPVIGEKVEIADTWISVVKTGSKEADTGWITGANVSITDSGKTNGLAYLSTNEKNAEKSPTISLKESSGDSQTILGWKELESNHFAYKKFDFKIDGTEPWINSLSYRESDEYDSPKYEPTGDKYYFGPNKPVTLVVEAEDDRSGISEINVYFDPNMDQNNKDDYAGYKSSVHTDVDDVLFSEVISQGVVLKKYTVENSAEMFHHINVDLPLGDYVCRIFVEVVDNAGNSHVVKGSVIENANVKNGTSTIIEDATAPDCIITVEGIVPENVEGDVDIYKNGNWVDGVQYFRNNVGVTIDLYENNYTDGMAKVSISSDGGETFKEMNSDDVKFSFNGNDHYVYKIDGIEKNACKATANLTFKEDGKYLIKVDATDNSGNKMTAVCTKEIVIDTVAPKFKMTFSDYFHAGTVKDKIADANLNDDNLTNDDLIFYYGKEAPANGGVALTLEITEENFYPQDVEVILETEGESVTSRGSVVLYSSEKNYWKSTKQKDNSSDDNKDAQNDDDQNDDDDDQDGNKQDDDNQNDDQDGNKQDDDDQNDDDDDQDGNKQDDDDQDDGQDGENPDSNSTNSFIGSIFNGISNSIMRKGDGPSTGGNGEPGNSGNDGPSTGGTGEPGNGGNTEPGHGANHQTVTVSTSKLVLFSLDDFGCDEDTLKMKLENGQYRVVVMYSDRSGNKMELSHSSVKKGRSVFQKDETTSTDCYITPHLVLDTKAPVASVTYTGASKIREAKGFSDDNTYKYYSHAITGTVIVEEANFDSSSNGADLQMSKQNVSNGPSFGSINNLEWGKGQKADQNVAKITYSEDGNYGFKINKLIDLAGNSAELPKPDYFTVDKTNPKITEIKYSTPVLDTVLNAVTFGFYNAKVTVSVTAEDATAGVHEFNYSYTNAAGVSGVNASLSNQIVSEGNIKYSNDHSKATLTFTIPKDALDSNHQFNGTVKVSVKDRSDNSAAREDNKRIVVDTIAPTATVSYNAPVNERGDKFYYAGDITGTVTINEANFYATDVDIRVSKNGSEGSVLTTSWTDQSTDVHVGHFTLSEEGEYIVRINYKDKSTNTMTEYVSGLMVIDKTIDEPVFKINGVEKSGDMGGAYKDELNVSYSFNDTNYNASEVKLTKISFAQKDDVTATYIKTTETSNGGNGTFDIAKAVDTDGIYLLEISMSDLAGHSIEQYVKFTANRYGSVFEYSDYLVWLISDGGQYVKLNGDEAIADNLVITEYNPDRVENGSLSITATRDGEAVPVDYTTVESEINRSAEQTPNGWFTYIYTIDKANFIEDGHYKISISSSDATGNTTTSVPDNSFDERGNKILDIMSFTVDTTNPEIRNIINLDSSVINAQTLEVKYSLLDLGGLKSVEAYVDGKPVETALDLEQGSNNYNGSFILEDSPVAQEVRLVIEDLAGNVTDTDDATWKDEQVRAGSYVFKNPVTVSTNLMVLWLANKFAFFGSIGLVTVLVIGGVVFVVARKKRY